MNVFFDVLLIFIPMLFASIFSYFVWRFCRWQNLYNAVSARSSHTIETLRGGGLTFILPTLGFSFFWYMLQGVNSDPFYGALFVGSAVLGGLGFLEDKYTLPTALRLLVETCVVSCMVSFLPPVFETFLGFWGDKVLLVLAWVWFINLYNFMDGLNTFATGYAIFIAIVLTLFGSPLHAVLLVLSGSCIGFLRVNITPAKMFMGDAGSLFLGCFLGGALLGVLVENVQTWFFPLLTLTLVFTFDTLYTLVCRLFQGKSPFKAHNEHLYQRVSRLGVSHEKTTLYALYLSGFFFILALVQLLTSFDIFVFIVALFVCFAVVRYISYLEGDF